MDNLTQEKLHMLYETIDRLLCKKSQLVLAIDGPCTAGKTTLAGILKDKDDPSTLIPHVTINEARELYDSGVISGGMIPKVDCCIDALEHGVDNVVIMDGRIPHSILMELLTDEGAGTMVMKG